MLISLGIWRSRLQWSSGNNRLSLPLKLIVRFSFTVTTTKLWESHYSEYQQYLFNRICEYKDCFLTPIGYRKISQIFNDEGLKTPGSMFHMMSIKTKYCAAPTER